MRGTYKLKEIIIQKQEFIPFKIDTDGKNVLKFGLRSPSMDTPYETYSL